MNRFNLDKQRWAILGAALVTAASLSACGGGQNTVGTVPQSITSVGLSAPNGESVGQTGTLSAVASSGLSVFTFSSKTSSICTVNNTTVTFAQTGTCTINVVQAGNSSFQSTQTDYNVTVSPQSYPPVIVVQNQTASLNSYDGNSSSLPGNNPVGSYSFGSGFDPWWAGVGTDSVYKGIGLYPGAVGAGIGVYVAGAGSRTWDITHSGRVTVGLGTNAECVGICKATIVLKSSTANCTATINTPFTILTSAVNTGLGITGTPPVYTSNLTDANWAVSCGSVTTMAGFTALPLKEVHAQLLQANMQRSIVAGGTTQYANGINLGSIVFN
jgi:hypothetical protein